jgi:DNA-binding response OmpR family regulator
MHEPYRILCVEDDADIGRLVSTELEASGYSVDWVADGLLALDRFRDKAFDLVILDLMLPSLGGLDVCRRIRESDRHTSIIMLTAKAALSDIVRGLELGADDYITKPFRNQELKARVQAILRRVDAVRRPESEAPRNAPIQRGALTIDPERHEVALHGKPVTLTAKEFALLLLFASHPGRCFRRGELLDAVWGSEFDGFDHTVNTHINRLRAKIEDDPGSPRRIRTVWGVGYRFAEIEELE